MTPSAQTAPVLTQNSPKTRDSRATGRWRRGLITTSFLAPALIVLGALVVYPIIYTLIRSFYSKSGSTFVGFDNYIAMFTNDTTYTAIRNNVMWVIIAPVVCTFLGLIFAVLMEKLRWKTAFRLIIFMPMAISMLAAGVIFRTMFQEDPNLGVVNATIAGVQNAFSSESNYPGARPREGFDITADDGVVVSVSDVSAGSSVTFPLIGIRQTNVPDDAQQAVAPSSPTSRSWRAKSAIKHSSCAKSRSSTGARAGSAVIPPDQSSTGTRSPKMSTLLLLMAINGSPSCLPVYFLGDFCALE